MNDFWAVIYGIVQGVTEFLPVSSSGHLALLPTLANFKDPGVAFDLAMHLGTAFSVIVYFRIDILRLLKGVYSLFNKNVETDYFTLNFILTTIFTGVIAFTLKGFSQELGRNAPLICINLILFGLILFLSDKYGKEDNNFLVGKRGIFAAIIIGISQVLAIFPGVSRSGITISAARCLGIPKEEASRFSFLLSLPLIIAASIFKYKEIFVAKSSFDLSSCVIGMLVSFIIGIATMHLFLKLLYRIKFFYFFLYRLVLASVVIYLTCF